MSSKYSVGDLVRVELSDGRVLEGIIMPSTEFSSRDVLIIKLRNGYNIGVSLSKARVKVVKQGFARIGVDTELSISRIEGKGDLRVSLISTGGTIVSRVEYETGAVKPAITAEELVEMVPEFRSEASEVEVVELYRIFSEDMMPGNWERISLEVYDRLSKGYDCVIVAHGTDTLAYTSSAIAFAVRNLPSPVMFVGAQRSSDRPSTDAVFNLRACLSVARNAPFGESVIVMHGSISDEYMLVHRGVKARKMHTSRRDAFQSINDVPLAKVVFPEARYVQLNHRYIPRSDVKELTIRNKFCSDVALLKFYPGMKCSIIDYLVESGYKGIIIEGTGLGHIRGECVESVKRAVDRGVIIGITSQTLFGRVNLKVYSNGRKLIEAGATPLSDMLPETAYVKLSWILGNFNGKSIDELREILTSNLVNEVNPIHDDRCYARWYHG